MMGILFFTAVVVAAVDQLTKLMVVSRLRGDRTIRLRWVAIRRVKNSRASKLTSTRTMLLTLWIAEVLVVVMLIRTVPALSADLSQVGLGTVLGGVTGNMFDRIWRAGVIDFVDLKVWPVFNLADAGIVAGVCWVAILLLQ
jgi:signal peptidase II